MIITKRSRIYTVSIVIICILAGFLRLYGISDHTEFLADQGSAGVVIYDWYKTGVIPWVGPTVSTGQRPGPVYYYLIALPLILSNFNPVVPAITFAILGVVSVYLLYWLGQKLWGRAIGVIVASLYAVSPTIIAQNRNMWNPTLIPFFVTVLLVAFYHIWKEKQFNYLLLASFCVSVLLQLHYSNIFTLMLFVVFWLVLIKNQRKEKVRSFLGWSLAASAVFFLVLSPFVFYEFTHKFIDIRELLLMIFFPTVPGDASQPFTYLFFDITSRLMRLVVPIRSQTILFLLFLGSVGFSIWKSRSFWTWIILIWFTAGAVFAGMYGGTVYDHYIYFIYPLPFLLFGCVLSALSVAIKNKVIIYTILATLLLFHLSKSDVFTSGVSDISRTRAVAETIIKVANGQPLSFTLISSRSFSDYHYRFFFTLGGITARPIISQSYTQLFLICETGDCPSGEELVRRSVIDVLCYDHHCKGEYPKLALADFAYQSSTRIHDATIYSFLRK